MKEKLDYIQAFENMGFGIFIHFGLYSLYGKGEWAEGIYQLRDKGYEKLIERFNPNKNWAKDLIKTAKKAGCKYATLTTRHHDGFSLFNTNGLSDFDAVHAKCGRDLVQEFVDACRGEGIVPFFYHTLLDWHNKDYNGDFNRYLDYLYDSVQILCTKYGHIGGFWFDGWWDKVEADWKFDRLYAMIRKYQPKAMIINNTGLRRLGEIGHSEIDSVTYERGKPFFVEYPDGKYRAGEMCQVFNDHWGYAKNDFHYKPLNEIMGDFIDCRKYNCNFLLNVGPKGNGSLRLIDKAYLIELGEWIKLNQNFIYKARACELTADGADVLYDGEYYYAVIKNVPMVADSNVQKKAEDIRYVTINGEVDEVIWLDNGERTKCLNNRFEVIAFQYGNSLSFRVAKFKLK